MLAKLQVRGVLGTKKSTMRESFRIIFVYKVDINQKVALEAWEKSVKIAYKSQVSLRATKKVS